MVEQTLKEKTAKGLFWGGLGSGMQQLLNLFFGIFLARILSPTDYGLVGMLGIFFAIASTIQESGFSAALTNKHDAMHKDYNAVFWFSTLTGIGMYLILFFCAPLIAAYFNEPRLTSLARFLFLGFLIASSGIAHNAILFKHLRVKEKAKMEITAVILSGTCGLIMAFHGMGYWGIATQSIVYIASVTSLRWYYSPWRPSLPIDFRPLATMLPFSFKLFLTNIVNQINSNIYSAILGKYYTPAAVGFYTQGYKWTMMGQQTISGMINSIAQPVFAQIGLERERQIRVFRKLLRFTSFISFPALFGLALVGKEFIYVTIGEKWLPAVPIMQLLCVFGAIWPILNLYFQLAISLGRSGIYFWSNLCFGLFQIGVAFYMYRFGILWMVAAYVGGYVLLLIVWQLIIKKLIGLRNRDVLKDMLPYLACTAFVLGVTYLLTLPVQSVYLLLPAKIFSAVILYAVVMKLGKSVIFAECLSFFLRKIKK